MRQATALRRLSFEAKIAPREFPRVDIERDDECIEHLLARGAFQAGENRRERFADPIRARWRRPVLRWFAQGGNVGLVSEPADDHVAELLR